MNDSLLIVVLRLVSNFCLPSQFNTPCPLFYYEWKRTERNRIEWEKKRVKCGVVRQGSFFTSVSYLSPKVGLLLLQASCTHQWYHTDISTTKYQFVLFNIFCLHLFYTCFTITSHHINCFKAAQIVYTEVRTATTGDYGMNQPKNANMKF